ncbi:23S rRNA (pseudouridine(1915)-N(3))-methyltransferase RlmH [Ignatzschineria cameli]|uniref:Ribosomal RNA large subunit methyltransferase H n=1 Tax=Ignatzschineria cameli TaxID=2182793 RepID=A0A2U2ASG5_9GAMM|nr:23S rRNA (pseudouridine(1915)-N(3))-methyltransferase RlmH [Ignatzschineria cameli]PWD86478.1 23S rRNA (pseudouridine(1915)-N(3))-methyltransferase RlmH [Ignatzschineria cameli]PWD87168.1 23S rRNA (pseudouridine(1915)-N(3))-methyltransferase RlmH [Ignatzschineria cameli]PWD92141.1 23S rRNA (pseudouridine(1915)-N(3))-methyltransferase RlmH [Ignatzschineria cameli]PWD93274.1 23S rRNA (pseudouridine(1915)-N(3))-methyltransferase RlmH [Ignatzschineria cameli]PWD94016.1 23S rRNA (pseudouridine(1
MIVYLIAVGSNMPSWVKVGFEEYAGRLRHDVELKLIEVPALVRKKNADVKRILKEEGEKLLKAIPKNTLIVGLDVVGREMTTMDLSKRLESWMQSGQDVALLVGGPEGFSPEIKALFQQSISLSKLTLPHPMVRVLIAEQLFRAWSIINNHPYHRE